MSSSPRLEQQRHEYSEFEFQDSEPLLANIGDSDEESTIESNEQKYKLPSEGGTIFSSFASIMACTYLNFINSGCIIAEYGE